MWRTWAAAPSRLVNVSEHFSSIALASKLLQ
jgi:hypothetical protein